MCQPNSELKLERSFYVFEVLKSRITKRNAYKKTVAELSALSDRRLNDLGIQRANIAAVARKAAQ
jgi:uncharacterized protein YjiS (DUF1127 family)